MFKIFQQYLLQRLLLLLPSLLWRKLFQNELA